MPIELSKQKLIILTEDVVRHLKKLNSEPDTERPDSPKQNRASFLTSQYPEFAQALLETSKKIDANVTRIIDTLPPDGQPTEETAYEHNQLVNSECRLMQNFANKTGGSIDGFRAWWNQE